MAGGNWEGEVRELRSTDAPGCDAAVASLPYFFGQAAGITECRAAVRSEKGIVALEPSGAVAGFLTVHASFAQSVEITWMAVHQGNRRRGVGRRLIQCLSEEMRARGVRLIFVITLGSTASEPDVSDGYAGTRLFYERVGFTPLKELDIWGPGSPGLILARAVMA